MASSLPPTQAAMTAFSWNFQHRFGATLLSLLLTQLSGSFAKGGPPVVKFQGTEVIGTSFKYLGLVEEEFFGGVSLNCDVSATISSMYSPPS